MPKPVTTSKIVPTSTPLCTMIGRSTSTTPTRSWLGSRCTRSFCRRTIRPSVRRSSRHSISGTPMRCVRRTRTTRSCTSWHTRKSKDIDLQSAVRYLSRQYEYQIEFPVQMNRQDVFYIEPGDRDDYKQTNYVLPPDERRAMKNNGNPFEAEDQAAGVYPNYDYTSGRVCRRIHVHVALLDGPLPRHHQGVARRESHEKATTPACDNVVWWSSRSYRKSTNLLEGGRWHASTSAPGTIRAGPSAISLLLCPSRSRATPAVADDAAETTSRRRRQVKSVGVGSDSRQVPRELASEPPHQLPEDGGTFRPE